MDWCKGGHLDCPPNATIDCLPPFEPSLKRGMPPLREAAFHIKYLHQNSSYGLYSQPTPD
jgi:hypothetical protein